MPTPIRKVKNLPTITERGHVKKIKTPRHMGKTTAVRSIQEGFEDVRSDNPRSEKNHFRKSLYIFLLGIYINEWSSFRNGFIR